MLRKAIYVIAVAMLGVAPANLVYGFDPGSPDLLAWWTCDEGEGAVVGDVSGYGHDGVFVFGDPAWVEGISGSAVQLVGPTLVEVAPLNVELNEATMAGWIKPNGSQPNWASIMMMRDPGLATGFNVLGYQLAYHWNDTSASWNYRGGDMIAADDWTFAAVTVAPDKATFYVNGVPGSVNTVAHAPCLLNSKIYLGGDGTSGWVSRRMNGALDNVALFQRALTGEEILEVMGGVEEVDLQIPFAMKAPVIDGEADLVWEDAPAYYFVPLADPADGSGTWKVLYDAENLYVLVDITDDSLQNDSANAWQDDSVEVYFDGGNTKLSTALSGDDHQYTFGWTADDIQGTNIAGYTEGIEQAQVTTATGWRIEIKMPWLAIQGAAAEARDLIGIDCYYNDDDDGGDTREGKMLSFSPVEGWNDASQWATAMLLPAPAPVDPGTNGLLARYAFENDVKDLSGNGLDGAAVGAVSYVAGPAGYGTAMAFDGTAYVVCPNNAALDAPGPISLSLWIKPGADDPEGNATATAPMAKALSGMSPSWSWQVRYGWNSPQPYMAFTFNSSPRAWAYVGRNLERDEWCHIACAHDGATLKCYLNGEQTDSTAMGAITGSSTPLLIGSDGWGSNWIGAIDEVAIYNRGLSQGEILYLAGFRQLVDPGTKGLVASYTFDVDAADTSGNGHDGTLLGDAAVLDGALVLDGDGDAVAVPAIGSDFTELTYSMYVYPMEDLVPLQFSGGMNTNTWGAGAIHFKMNYGHLNAGINGLAGGDLVGTTVVPSNQWSHIALTISQTEAALYLNGVVEASRVLAAPLTNLVVGNAAIGAWNNGGTAVQREMAGQMDDVLIYSRALSVGEIRYLAGNR